MLKMMHSISCRICDWGFITLYMLIAFFTLLVLPSTAILVNITVDDTFGSKDGTVIPEYLPANGPWHVGSPTEQCDVCAIKPSELDTSQILDQSWHHGSYLLDNPISVQVTFRGTAVYVYNVVPNTIPGANTFMNISFAIDGETVGQFSHVPDSSSEIMYNHLVYANATLSDSSHTLIMSASGSNESFIFFDYLLYTTTEVNEPAMPPSPISSTASPSSTSSPSTTPSSSHMQTAITITASATVFLGSTTPSSAAITTSPPSQIQTVTTISAALDTVTVSAGSSTTSSAPSSSSSSPPKTGLIAGGVIAGIALLVMVPAIIFTAIRHGRRSRRARPGPYAWPSDAAASTDHWTEYKMTSSSLSLAPSVRRAYGLGAGERSVTNSYRTSLAGAGARHGLPDEITALPVGDFAGAMVSGGQSACEEMLPGYEDVDLEQRHSRDTPGYT